MKSPKSAGNTFESASDLTDFRVVVYRDLLSGTFRHLSVEDWKKLLPVATSSHVRKDKVVLWQGMPGQGLFIVAEGVVRVVHVGSDERQTRLATLGAGEVFGEMSFLEKSVSSASVMTDVSTELIHIDTKVLLSLFEADHEFEARFYRSLALALSNRLRRTNYLV